MRAPWEIHTPYMHICMPIERIRKAVRIGRVCVRALHALEQIARPSTYLLRGCKRATVSYA